MNQISGLGSILNPDQISNNIGKNKVEKSFGELLANNIQQVSDLQAKSDTAIQQMHVGDSKNLHGAMIAMEEADISLRFLVQVRNKAMEAYQEIMRMQV